MPEPDDLEHAIDDAFGPGAEERAERTAGGCGVRGRHQRGDRFSAGDRPRDGALDVDHTRVTDVFDDEV